MTTTIVVVVIVLLLLAAAAYFFMQNQRRSKLHQRFGPEYDRQVEGAENRAQAERHLTEVARKRDELEIRELDDAQRAVFAEQWQVVQARFVDEPAAAVDGAESLVDDVLRTRGYPADDFDAQTDLVAADHPEVVQHYRDAHDAHERHRSTGQTDTEDLRQAFVHYRALFDSLVGREEQSAMPRHDPARSDQVVDADRVDGQPVDANLPPERHPERS